jgi:hypothetical protein
LETYRQDSENRDHRETNDPNGNDHLDKTEALSAM